MIFCFKFSSLSFLVCSSSHWRLFTPYLLLSFMIFLVSPRNTDPNAHANPSILANTKTHKSTLLPFQILPVYKTQKICYLHCHESSLFQRNPCRSYVWFTVCPWSSWIRAGGGLVPLSTFLHGDCHVLVY